MHSFPVLSLSGVYTLLPIETTKMLMSSKPIPIHQHTIAQPNTLVHRTKSHIRTTNSKLLKGLILPLNSIPLKQMKSVFSAHGSSQKAIKDHSHRAHTEAQISASAPVARTNISRQSPKLTSTGKLHTKNVKVVTRSDLLNNTYSLDRIMSAEVHNEPNDNRPVLKKAHTHGHNSRRSRSKNIDRASSTRSVPTKANSYEFPTNSPSISEELVPRTPSVEIKVDTIDDVTSDYESYFPKEQMKTEFISLESTFTNNGELLSIPVHKALTLDSEISDYQSAHQVL